MRITLVLLLILCLLWAWCLPGNEVETVSMYMYNGVKLPALPEFEYEYAYIAENVAIKGWYALFVSDKAFVYDKLTNTMIRQDGSTVMRCVCTGEAWGEFVAHDADSLLAPIWANYDVLDTNGDVRLYATEPAKMWENARSFLIGLAMAFAGKPLPISQGEKEPVAYLYNGVRLPKLPEDGVYAVIIPRTAVTVTGKKDAYHLYTATAPLYAQLMHYNGEITGRIIKVKEVHTQKHYECYAGETEWKLVYTSVDDIAGGYLDWDTDDQPTLWANTDIYYSDKTVDNNGEYAGKLYIGASEPIPVYE